MDYQETIDLKRAKTRCWGIWVSHLFLAPVASCVYAAKTNNWLPTAVATGVAVVGIPLAVIDLGITTAIAAPVTSAAMLSGKVQEARRKKGIFIPEEAEAKLFDGLRV
jgi:uncharacterized membrane protein YccF (DUF307 family)